MSMIKLGVFWCQTRQIITSPRFGFQYFVRKEADLQDWEQEVTAALHGPVEGLYKMLVTIFGKNMANEFVARGELPSMKRSLTEMGLDLRAIYDDSGEFQASVSSMEDNDDNDDGIHGRLRLPRGKRKRY